jgi:hypothetical protein
MLKLYGFPVSNDANMVNLACSKRAFPLSTC